MHDRLKRARAALLRFNPFWGLMLLRMEFTEDKTLDAPMATDGRRILHRPELWEVFSDPEIAFIIAHEVLHIIGAHHCRRAGRDVDGWNIAADYAVNALLIDAARGRHALKFPDALLYDPKFNGWSAEAIYAYLRANARLSQGSGTYAQSSAAQPGPSGGDSQSWADPKQAAAAKALGYVLDATDPPQAEQDLNRQLAEANTWAQAGGLGSDTATARQLERAKVSADWQRHLAACLFQAATRAGFDDYSWSRPKPYALQSLGVYLPATIQNEPPPFTIALDTSGSVTPGQLAEMADGIRGLLNQWESAEADVIYCDSRIRGRAKVCSGQPVKLEPLGGGGTLFDPVFNVDRGRAFLVYFTDLEPHRHHFPPRPAYPVLWVYTGRHEVPPPVPYGQVVRLRRAKHE